MATAERTLELEEIPLLTELPVEHLFDLAVDLEPAQVVPTNLGTRMNFRAKRGRFEGPKLRGELLPGFGDALLVGSDQVGRIRAYATLRTEDGAMIEFTAGGVIKIPADGLQRLADGERLPFGETYVRTTPKLETADERYAWLNELVLVGLNQLSPNHVDYRIYKVR
jgi:hypothetical protein